MKTTAEELQDQFKKETELSISTNFATYIDWLEQKLITSFDRGEEGEKRWKEVPCIGNNKRMPDEKGWYGVWICGRFESFYYNREDDLLGDFWIEPITPSPSNAEHTTQGDEYEKELMAAMFGVGIGDHIIGYNKQVKWLRKKVKAIIDQLYTPSEIKPTGEAEWISVESKPSKGKRVLLSDGLCVWEGWLHTSDKKWMSMSNSFNRRIPTHWKPLPPLPPTPAGLDEQTK